MSHTSTHRRILCYSRQYCCSDLPVGPSDRRHRELTDRIVLVYRPRAPLAKATIKSSRAKRYRPIIGDHLHIYNNESKLQRWRRWCCTRSVYGALGKVAIFTKISVPAATCIFRLGHSLTPVTDERRSIRNAGIVRFMNNYEAENVSIHIKSYHQKIDNLIKYECFQAYVIPDSLSWSDVAYLERINP